ncbi:MAG: sulfite exporter TauE/SafE family protein, partial [Yaniella sp.]|nr:sulfite exporter TauE/SafE family protein [Yaniella sp.]
METSAKPASRNWFGLVLLGLAVGVSSGLFGIGGGIIILPALVYLLGYKTRIAVGTSLLAVILPSIVGVISYAAESNVNLLMAALLAAGSIFGAPIGSWLLSVLPQRAVQWGFIAFMIIVIVS